MCCNGGWTHRVDRDLSSHGCHHAKYLFGLEGFYIEGARQVANPQARDYLVHGDGAVVVGDGENRYAAGAAVEERAVLGADMGLR